ncbi:MAG: type VI secretion system tube protein Hcp, partial [Phenylobacterium sp.]
ATGLQYPGSIGISAADIRQQKDLADFVRSVIDEMNQNGAGPFGLGAKGMGAAPDALNILDTVRRLIRQDPRVVTTAPRPAARAALFARAAAFTNFLIRPRSQRLAFADYIAGPDSENPPPGRVAALIAADRQRALTLGVLFALAVGVVAALRIFPGGDPLPGVLDIAGIFGESIVWVAVSVLVAVGLGAGAFTLILLAHEAGDRADPSNASPAQVTEVETFENAPGYAQNHMISVTRLKAGPFRRYTLALGMWIIRLLALFAFRQGNLARMGTIHFARWVKPPGAKALVFMSNYDGSWLSYLEDFTALASTGLNLAWGHSQGVPTARLMVLDGASDSDAFKRFAKRSLQRTDFWYSGYPGVTLENIRRNALIHDGLMRASNATEAQDWLEMLASVKRPELEIETEEVQTLVLRGLGSFPVMACAMIEIPPEADIAGWTRHLSRTVTFGNANAAATTASFTANGTYVLRLAADDGVLSNFSEVTIDAGSTGATTMLLTLTGYPAPITVLEFSDGVMNSASANGGGGAGKASFQSANFSAREDASAPMQLLGLAAGTHIQQALVELRSVATGKLLSSWKFQDVVVISLDVSATALDPVHATRFALAYSTITY